VHQRGLMGEAESAYVGSGFWAGLTLGMLASIALANQVPCRTLLASATLAAVLPAGAIVVFPESKLVAWVASCLFGVCLGPIYPSVMAFFTAEVGCRVCRRPTPLDMTSSLAPLSCTQPGFVGSLVLLVCCVDLASRHSVVCATCALFCERHWCCVQSSCSALFALLLPPGLCSQWHWVCRVGGSRQRRRNGVCVCVCVNVSYQPARLPSNLCRT
jgi:hypothetical protein